MVTLYMDGATYEPYLVTNDWPIHPSHIAMQLTVGKVTLRSSPSPWPICVQSIKGTGREKGKASGMSFSQENILSPTNKTGLKKLRMNPSTNLV